MTGAAGGVSLSDYDITETGDGSGTIVAAIQLVSNGDLGIFGNALPNTWEWLSSQFAGAGDDYTARATVIAGIAPNFGTAIDTDAPLTSNVTFGQEVVGIGVRDGTIRVDIKRGGVIVASGVQRLFADNTP